MESHGILTVISGFSGVGKGTVVKQLLDQYENYALSISATTRQPREGEQDGVHYFFRSREEFETMIARDQLIEYACYVDNYYGTPKEYVEQQLSLGKDVILEIELQGALKVKERFPDTLLIFLTAPNADVLENRLINRGTEDKAVVAARLARAYEESEYISQYDYLIVNNRLEDCVRKVHQTIQCERARAFRNKDMIEKLRAELQKFSKGE